MYRLPCQLVCLLFCLLRAATASRQPVKRSYNSHDYYVLELASHDEGLAQQTAIDLNAEFVEQVGELDSHFLIRAPKLPEDHRVDAVLESYERLRRKRSITSIRSLEKQVLKKRVKRVYPQEVGFAREKRQPPAFISEYLQDIVKRFSLLDPIFPKQWHLANDRAHERSINVTGVWAEGITGDGIKVAIVDDGLDSMSIRHLPDSVLTLNFSAQR